MAAPKGHKRYGGRQKGTPNKSTEDLLAICEKHGVNVFESMVILAAGEANRDKKFEKMAELAPYLYAKRKAVELSNDPEGDGFVIKILDFSQEKK